MKKEIFTTNSKWNLNCKEATFLTELSKEEKLSLSLRLRLWFHLSVCPPCKRFKTQTLLLASKLKNLGTISNFTLEDSDKKQLEDRIKQSLSKK